MRKLFTISVFLCFYFCNEAQTIIASGPTSFCQGDSVVLSVSGATGSPTYQWILNGNNITGATNNSLNVLNAGAYNVVYTQGTNSQTLNEIVVTIHPLPTASFTFNPNNACAKTAVHFTNSSTGSGLTYSWNFGDPASGTNNTSSALHPVHQFVGTPGTGTQNFAVKLIATSVNGCKDSITSTVTAKQRPDPQLGGTGATTYNGLPYFRVCASAPTSNFTFTNLSTTSATNTNYTIVWGDNTPSFNQSTFLSTTHTYATGTYTLQFIVSGNNGCADTGTYYVFAGSNPAVGLNNPGNTNICSGSQLTFPITGTATNPPGTTYVVTFNDGSSSTSFNHPPPDSVTHLFTNSSCGTNSLSYSNSFSAVINASNPCGSSSSFVVPIYVSRKPMSSISVSPKDTVCVNNLVTIFNNGNSGNSIDNGVCTPGKSIWTITPSTGFSLVSGALGNTFGSNDPSVWQAGTTSFILNFSTPGTYTIKLKAGANSFCGSDSVIKTICVNPIPVAAFDVDNITGCAPLNVTTTNNTNIPFCGQNTYVWTVSYTSTAGCTPNTSGFSYINGTNASSTNPQFQFTNPGVYTISLRAIAPAGSCSSVVVTKQITIKGKPVVNMSLAPAICAGQSVSPTATNSCYIINGSTTHAWSFTGGNPSSASTLIPGTITYATAGTYSVSLTVTNECGPTTVTSQITVNPVPAAPAAGNNGPLCSGNALNLTASTSTTGVTYLWTGPAAFSSTLQNPSRPNATTAMSGNYTVVVSLNGCTSSGTTNVVINQTPTNPVVTSPVNYCQNATAVPLTATGTSGNSFNWYTVATGGTPNTTAPTPNTSTLGPVTYYVSQVSTASPPCESGRVPIVVNVYSVPAINGSFTDPTTCASSNGTITITGLSANTTYSIQYVKDAGSPTTISLTSNASGVIIINNLSSGSYTNITASLNGCASNTIGPFILVNPSAPAAPTAGNNGPLCTGSTLNLSATSSSGGSFSWTGPGGFTSNQQNPTRPNVTTAMNGTYSVTVTLNGCTSVGATTSVTIVQTPNAPAAISPINYCQNANAVPLTATAGSGNSLNWYTVSTGGTAGTIPPVPSTNTPGVVTYYVSQVTSAAPGCESGRTPIIVNVYAVPVINGNYTDPTNCLLTDGTITINGLNPNTTYSIQYVKNGGSPTTISLTSNGSGVAVITNLAAGSYTNITATVNGCASNILGPFILVNPSAPTAPSAGNNGPLCAGSTLNLTSSPVSGATYAWSGPGGFTSTLQNPTRPNANAGMNGNYTVTVTLNGCTSAPATTNVTVTQIPNNPVVTSPVNYCHNATASPLTAIADPGNFLKWYTSATGGTGSTTAPTPSTSIVGTINYYVSQVTSAAPGCESGRTAITVNVYAVPAITGSFTGPTNCLIANGTITITSLLPNTTYNIQYTKDGGTPVTASLTSNTSGAIILSNLSVGTYSNINAASNGCQSNIIGPFILVNPNPPATPAAINNGPLCSGTTLNLMASSTVSGVTYSWIGPGGFTSTLQNPARPNSTAAMSGTYSVTATLNGCVSAPANTNVLINQTPPDPGVNSPVNFCYNATATALTATGTTGNIFNWYTTATGGTASTNAPMPVTTVIGSTTYYVSQYNSSTTCESNRIPIVVTINPIPVIGVSASPPSTCTSSNASISLTGLTANNTYNVQYTVNGVNISAPYIANANGNITVTNLPAGVYSNISASFNGCPSNIVGPFTLINPSVPATPTAGSNSPLCIGSTLNLTANSITPGITYSWTGPAGFTSNQQNPSLPNISMNAAGRYYVLARINTCISQKDSVDVIINTDPVVNLGPDLLLAPGVQHLLTSTIQNGTIIQYLWTPSANLSCTNCPLPTVTVQSNISYSVQVTNVNGCKARDTINIRVICEGSQVFIPNAFSPDGDGINDVMMIRSAGVITVNYFRIFNKWGELVFEKNNFSTNDFGNAWDGKIKGVLSPPDVFVYTAEIVCENGTKYPFKGNITLLR